VSNFPQFVDRNFVLGGPNGLNLTLTTAWDKATPAEGCELVIVTQPAVRRTMGIMHTPKRIAIKAQDPRLEELLQLNSKTSEAHVAKFDAQAAQAKTDRANRKIVADIRANMAKLGLTL
jgi:hypothetical protein